MTETQAEQHRAITAEIAAVDADLEQLKSELFDVLPILGELHTRIANDRDWRPNRDELVLLSLPTRFFLFVQQREDFTALLQQLPLHELN